MRASTCLVYGHLFLYSIQKSKMFISLLNAYSSLFYSYNRIFGAILLLASFLHPFSGFCGLIGWGTAVCLIRLLRYNPTYIKDATLTYNPLMTGLGLGALYAPNFAMLIMVILISSITFLFTLFLWNILYKYHFPFLSIPFLFTFWFVVPALSGMQAIQTSTFEVYYLNTLYGLGGKEFIKFYADVNNNLFPLFINAFLQTLSVIFFQNNIFTGILVAIGLFIHSRLAFLYALWGYAVAFGFYTFAGIDVTQLLAFHAGFNYIVIAVSIGTYYTTPSWSSLVTATFAVLVTILLAQGLQNIFTHIHTSAYSLPFAFTVLMFLWALRQRGLNKYPQLSLVQYFSPEKNFYRQSNNNERLQYLWYLPIDLPFFGEWIVSQGYTGKHTHLGEWAHALDFVIVDEEMKQYAREGIRKEDYYAFNKPITAPADGYIIAITDVTDDNEAGEVDTTENWGNTIIIKHAEGLYSQLSHLKRYSPRIQVGNYVHKGDWIANCGSSGRSPFSHLHFQLQATPYVGAKTLAYPLGYYLSIDKGQKKLHTFTIPKEGEQVQNIALNSLLQKAFGFTPLQKITLTQDDGTQNSQWECFTDAYNGSYLYCATTKSYAYFVNDGTMFYFTNFEGDKNSWLFYFYLACYKVLQGFYEEVEITDKFPLDLFVSPYNVINDMFAPFIPLSQASYKLQYTTVDDANHPRQIQLESIIEIKMFKRLLKKYLFKIELEDNRLSKLTMQAGKQKINMLFS